jgi:hypothetical protein
LEENFFDDDIKTEERTGKFFNRDRKNGLKELYCIGNLFDQAHLT